MPACLVALEILVFSLHPTGSPVEHVKQTACGKVAGMYLAVKSYHTLGKILQPSTSPHTDLSEHFTNTDCYTGGDCPQSTGSVYVVVSVTTLSHMWAVCMHAGVLPAIDAGIVRPQLRYVQAG